MNWKQINHVKITTRFSFCISQLSYGYVVEKFLPQKQVYCFSSYLNLICSWKLGQKNTTHKLHEEQSILNFLETQLPIFLSPLDCTHALVYKLILCNLTGLKFFRIFVLCLPEISNSLVKSLRNFWILFSQMKYK